MHIHPWTSYEIARLNHEERLQVARAAMRSLEARKARSSRAEAHGEESARSWLDRIRHRHPKTGTPARSGI